MFSTCFLLRIKRLKSLICETESYFVICGGKLRMYSEMLQNIVDVSHLTYWYQPIYELRSKNIIGFEALVRDKIHNTFPVEIFQEIQLNGLQSTFDRQLLLMAQQMFQYITGSCLFLNVMPSTLLSPRFLYWWDKCSEIAPSLVLEISESQIISDWRALKGVTAELQKRGIKIAIDDMGAGYSSFKHIVELEPDYIKLDKYYVDNLSASPIKQRILEGLIKVVGGVAEIIIEGVEDVENLKVAKQLGIQYAQGYLLGRPGPINKFSNQPTISN